MTNTSTTSSFFNNRIELATRSSFILACLADRVLDIDRLVFFDYVLLYAKEFGGPINVHTDLPNKIAELIYRRESLPAALKLFLSRGIISSEINSTGIYFKANEETAQYIGCLKSEYYKDIWTNLLWLESNYESLDNKRIGYVHGFSERK
ncbi:MULTISPECIES: ABC-three component system middle component 2 [Duganella]|uniref:Uncharacterized protein n=2 Tax=Duganella TaxID=75654 RepID=A0A845GS99_9BURK|nr:MULTISPECIES: ABC-three component system middle component 2 [Duganella]MYM80790.1 hypothetical protein [Duganella lactea]MYM96106.1 hypothetical protein [Duganella vulcania]